MGNQLAKGLYGLMRLVLVFSSLCVMGFAAAQSSGNRDPAASETATGMRIALVIGNSAYQGAAALRNPANDAKDMANKLNKLGFDVTLVTDVPLRQMLRTLTMFGDKVRDGSEVLFFYAGHGMQVRGKNYLIPIDAEIGSESSVSSEAVDVDQLLDKLSRARLSMVILDACRNNPFERRFRGGGQGLAQINAPTGTLIAYATAPGKVASDGEGRNGLYTSELLSAMDEPGIRVEDVFKRVRREVIKKSSDTQTPWESSSLTGDFYFIHGATLSEQFKEEKEALLHELKKQREAQERAMDDVLRKANEQAARERLELQKSMERMLQEALTRQEAQLAEERSRRNELAVQGQRITSSPAPSTNEAAGLQSSGKISASTTEIQSSGEKPLNLAIAVPSVAKSQPPLPLNPSERVIDDSVYPGDEWEYATRDDLFGKKGKLIMRVKAVSERGVLEEVIWNDKYSFEWAFGKSIAAVGTPNESEFLIAPHWNGDGLKDIVIEGGAGAWVAAAYFRIVNLKTVGKENLILRNGVYECIRIKGDIAGSMVPPQVNYGSIEFWYSTRFGRLLKQATVFMGQRQKFNETVELTAFRPAVR